MTGRFRMLLLLAASCVTVDPHPRFTPAWETVDTSGEGWLRTRKALLVADCQLHNLLSLAVPERNLTAEAAVATAIRPPQLDLFSADVLAWILAKDAPDADVVLHLGDALDFACTGEFDAFLEVMATSAKPWFMAPGNHDLSYFGTHYPERPELWRDASHGAGEPLAKDGFIRRYVGALLRQAEPGCAALAAAVGPAEELPISFEWHAPEDASGLLRAIAWSIDAERPWRSFILQAVAMTEPGAPIDVTVYLVDSCQYARRPDLVPNAWKSFPVPRNCGLTGDMLPDQLRTLRRWIASRPEESSVIACHHPFEGIAPRAKSSLGWLWREHRVSMLLTAHTHEGYFAHHDLGGPSDEVELNIASTTDWPMEWRTLMGFAHPGDREIYISSERHTLVDALRAEGGYFDRAWEVPLDSPDDYRRYKQGRAAKALLFDLYFSYHVTPDWLPPPRVRPNAAARHTEEQVKDTLLWTYVRLIGTFPTAPEPPPRWPEGCASDDAVLDRIRVAAADTGALERKIALLRELALFEKSRATADDPARVRFKVSQAAWASRFEASRGRRLRVEDDLIRVGWSKKQEGR
jgi:hypothetical protein